MTYFYTSCLIQNGVRSLYPIFYAAGSSLASNSPSSSSSSSGISSAAFLKSITFPLVLSPPEMMLDSSISNKSSSSSSKFSSSASSFSSPSSDSGSSFGASSYWRLLLFFLGLSDSSGARFLSESTSSETFGDVSDSASAALAPLAALSVFGTSATFSSGLASTGFFSVSVSDILVKRLLVLLPYTARALLYNIYGLGSATGDMVHTRLLSLQTHKASP
ncbi:hypothetical protein EJF18_10375 [Clavispora lusitaniae]|uniref:Uncharacterized protein n=1 Tax=Clavispora lusitaniae TaxID=36911 RepID=A0ACD0WDE8_CLALS|nr:hypothetical protein EJF14_10375 [Clavispora lusitaniae]QFZ31413.1 hypothetical protein EJF16_10375 [Clavispora lusitaniae]QFZ37081.1 hypothetical protein EJF15_10375 [Clavispora lusitaniae]QFZ42765.1 hypothetical protein EJF18_10375 [Clavispora lusitaniae]QFZ48441.1 hypothetical protein EJF17_10375 [Clavispora lusitaniae]